MKAFLGAGLWLGFWLTALAGQPLGQVRADDFDREPILYRDTAPNNPISRRQKD